MKKLYLLSFGWALSLSTSVFAAPLAGYSVLTGPTQGSIRGNEYQIVNALNIPIFTATQDTVRRVELRDGYAVVQSLAYNTVLYHENGTALASGYGSEFKISRGLFAVYNKRGNAKVFNLNGHELYPASGNAARPIRTILISNHRFALMDDYMDTLTVYNDMGQEIWSTRQVKHAALSDGFLVVTSLLGTVSIYDADLNLITTDSNIQSEVKISDRFVAYKDSMGALRIFSASESYQVAYLNNVYDFSLTNSYALVKDPFGISLYNEKGNNVVNSRVFKTYALSHKLFAYVTNTNALIVTNVETGKSFAVNNFAVNNIEQFEMSDDLLVTKNGAAQFTVYSLTDSQFGRNAYSFLDQTVESYPIGNGVVAFKKTLATSAANSLQVFHFYPEAGQIKRNVLIDRIRTDRVNLSVNREEWNWQGENLQ